MNKQYTMLNMSLDDIQIGQHLRFVKKQIEDNTFRYYHYEKGHFAASAVMEYSLWDKIDGTDVLFNMEMRDMPDEIEVVVVSENMGYKRYIVEIVG